MTEPALDTKMSDDIYLRVVSDGTRVEDVSTSRQVRNVTSLRWAISTNEDEHPVILYAPPEQV